MYIPRVTNHFLNGSSDFYQVTSTGQVTAQLFGEPPVALVCCTNEIDRALFYCSECSVYVNTLVFVNLSLIDPTLLPSTVTSSPSTFIFAIRQIIYHWSFTNEIKEIWKLLKRLCFKFQTGVLSLAY